MQPWPPEFSLLTTRGSPSPISTGHSYRDDRFSCSIPAPATSSRHLYTEHRQGHIQAAPWLRAEPQATPLSRDPQSLPTPALDRHDTAAVWTLRLHGEPGGPTSITGTARFVLAIFYIVITFLSGHTTPLRSEAPENEPGQNMLKNWLRVIGMTPRSPNPDCNKAPLIIGRRGIEPLAM